MVEDADWLSIPSGLVYYFSLVTPTETEMARPLMVTQDGETLLSGSNKKDVS